MSPRIVRTRTVQEDGHRHRLQLGAPFLLPRVRWGHTPPKPVPPVVGQLDLFAAEEPEGPGDAA